MKDVNKIVITLSTALCSTAALMPAIAEQAILEEVVVTAQKREQSLQEVPITVSAFSARDLEKSNIGTVSDLQYFTPGLSIYDAGVGAPEFYIRGIGNSDFGVGGNTNVGIYIDGVYTGRGGSALFDLANAERVEILKGPQGTLFGRNTIAGAISIHTKKPTDEFEGRTSLSLGNDEYYKGRVEVSGPISDSVLGRVTAQYKDYAGYRENVVNGADAEDEEELLLAGTLVVDLDDDATLTLTADYSDIENGGAIFNARETFAPIPVDDASFNLFKEDFASDVVDEREEREAWGVSAKYVRDYKDFTMTALTAYRTYELDNREDEDGTDFPGVVTSVDEENETLDVELKFSGTSDAMDWFIGASVFYEEVSQLTPIEVNNTLLSALFGVALPPGITNEEVNVEGEYWSFAIFGDITYRFSERININTGIRVTHDTKDFELTTPLSNPFAIAFPDPGTNFDDKDDWTSVNPRLVIDYLINDDVHAYIGVTNGYKSGGYNSNAVQDSYDQEIVWSYEAGIKAEVLDGRMRINTSIYYYDYSDLQVSSFVPGGLVPVIRNAGEATGQGAELDVIYVPAEGLTLIGSLGYTDAEFDEFVFEGDDFAGNPLPYSPEITASLIGEYVFGVSEQLDMSVRAEVSYTDDMSHVPDNLPIHRADDYTLVNGRIAILSKDGQWELAFWGKNLTDEEYLVNTDGAIEAFATVARAGTPLQYGVDLSFSF